jgi:hypothetical protein
MLPLYVTLQSALVAGLDHSGNQWKALFARPVPRWTVYLAKLIVVTLMTIAAVAILVAAVLAEGKLLHALNPELAFDQPAPLAHILRQAAQATALAFLFLSIQQWVSLRWRSFSASTGFGIVATITGFAMLLAAGQYGTWPRYFPWSLPALTVARQAQDIPTALSISILAALLITAAACRDFSTREIT